MGYRHKASNEPFAEFKIRARGTAERPAHTVELECAYNEAFCGKRGEQGELMRTLPQGSCYFDGEARVWRLLPNVKDDAVAVALKHYRHVYETEGERTTDLRSNQSFEQKGLF